MGPVSSGTLGTLCCGPRWALHTQGLDPRLTLDLMLLSCRLTQDLSFFKKSGLLFDFIISEKTSRPSACFVNPLGTDLGLKASKAYHHHPHVRRFLQQPKRIPNKELYNTRFLEQLWALGDLEEAREAPGCWAHLPPSSSEPRAALGLASHTYGALPHLLRAVRWPHGSAPHRGGRASSVPLCVQKGHRLHVLTPNPKSAGPQTPPRKQPVSPSRPRSDVGFAARGLPAFGKTCNVPAQQRCRLARRDPCRPRGSGW